MSWRKIPMRFPGTCTVCGKRLEVGQVGLWAKGMGVKHEECSGADELDCIVCGRPAGCPECEFQDGCDIPNVSPFCVCKPCSDQRDAFSAYRNAAGKRFRVIGT